MRLPLSRALPLATVALIAAPARAQDSYPDVGPPVTAPTPGSPPGPPPGPDWGRRPAPSEEVTYAPTFFARDAFPLAGFHQGRFYLRDPEDRVRLFPGGLLQLDSRAAFGRGVREVGGAAGDPLLPRMLVRRARLDLGGQIHNAWSFHLSGDFAQSPHVEYALVDAGFHRLFHVTLGQQLVPFSQANRTFEPYLPWLERPLTVRFALPRDKDLGALAWGETARGVFGYEVGAFGGDGGRTNVDRTFDGAGRIWARPLAGSGTIAQHIQVGASGMIGVRQIERVTYGLDPLTTEGGFAFWDTTRAEQGQTVKILPSGQQAAVGGEVRVPVSQLDLRFEFLYAKKNTREAIEGREAQVSERFGTLSGTAFYAHLGLWLLGTPAMLGTPGHYRPPRIRFPRAERPADPRGLMLALRFESLNATYDPGNRASAPGDQRPERDIKVRLLSAGLNYYAGRHAAVMLHYAYTVFPDSSVAQLNPTNLAVAPGNLSGHSGAHELHEVGGRVQVFF